MSSVDITVLPIHRQAGVNQAQLPGLHVASAPKRAGRGRRGDRLILYASFAGGSGYSTSQQEQLLATLERGYFKTTGTSTSALRTLADHLNEYLLKRNQAISDPSQAVRGLVSFVVVRENNLFMSQSGRMHGFLLTAEGIRHLYDPQSAGSGLGLSRTAQASFFQASLSPGDRLILLPKLPSGWNENTIKNARGQDLGHLYRSLTQDAGTDLTAVVLQADSGPGELDLLALAQPAPKAAQAKTTTSQPASPPQKGWEPLPDTLEEKEPTPPEISAEEVSASPAVSTSPPASQKATLHPSTPKSVPRLGGTLASVGRGAARSLAGVSRGALRLLERILPGEGAFTIPSSTMAWIAVAVPLIVVTISAVVYLRIGRQSQFDGYYAQAKNVAEYAVTLSEPQDVRAAWQTTLFYLDRADLYLLPPESLDLRAQAQFALDELDAVIRLDFRPAIAGTLGSAVQITRLIATGTDLYMLNKPEGTVLRAWLTGTGYEFDPEFRCGPGKYGAYIVDKLVDITALPRTNQNDASIVAMDSNGNLLFCSPDNPPLVTPLVPPDNAWGNPLAMTLEGGDLYILDPLTNAVWIYFAENDAYPEAPYLFFANEVPPMQTTIDLAVQRDDLFLLHSDGHITICRYSTLLESPTECEDPAYFSGEIMGNEQIAVLPNASLTQIIRTAPPEPSIFLLDPEARAIYHLSVRLNLQQQYRTDTSLPEGEITAFAVSPSNAVFIAIGHEVFVGFLP